MSAVQLLSFPNGASNNPKLSLDGRYVADGNGDVFVSDLRSSLPTAQMQLFGQTPPGAEPHVPMYAMGWLDFRLFALEVLAADDAIVWAFDPASNWSRSQVARGAFGGTSTFASKGHWSTNGGQMGTVVDGATFTPLQSNISGWEQDGEWCAYALKDQGFAIGFQKLNGTQFGMGPAGTGFKICDMGGYALISYLLNGQSWLLDTRSGKSVAVNMPPLVAQGVPESIAVPCLVQGMTFITTWDAAAFWCFLRLLESPESTVCVQLAMPGQFMQVRPDLIASRFVVAGNNGGQLVVALVPFDTPQETPDVADGPTPQPQPQPVPVPAPPPPVPTPAPAPPDPVPTTGPLTRRLSTIIAELTQLQADLRNQ